MKREEITMKRFFPKLSKNMEYALIGMIFLIVLPVAILLLPFSWLGSRLVKSGIVDNIKNNTQ